VPSLGSYAEANPEVRSLLEGPTEHKTVAERLKEAGVETSEASVRRWRNANSWDPQAALDVTGLSTEADKDAIISDLRASNRRLFKKAAAERQRGAEYIQTIYDAARDAREAQGPLPPVIGPKRDKRVKREEAALWHLTDWQGGKVTSSYNMDEMDKRVHRFAEKAAELTDIMRADHPVRHCEILLGGDMLEGVSIFPGQHWEVEAPLFDQIFRVADLITWAVRSALSIYETVEVVAEWGNHGRIGRKSDGYKPSDNVDRIIYEIARRDLSDAGERLVDFKVWDKWFQHFTIGNYRGLLVHGDEIKSFGGNTPAFGILRKANSWATGVVPAFDDMYIGHFHQPMELHIANGGAVFMTGSTESDNEYAREFVAAMSKPSQRLNFVDPEKGRVTYTSNIWVAD
jgi:hypothetical protein